MAFCITTKCRIYDLHHSKVPPSSHCRIICFFGGLNIVIVNVTRQSRDTLCGITMLLSALPGVAIWSNRVRQTRVKIEKIASSREVYTLVVILPMYEMQNSYCILYRLHNYAHESATVVSRKQTLFQLSRDWYNLHFFSRRDDHTLFGSMRASIFLMHTQPNVVNSCHISAVR